MTQAELGGIEGRENGFSVREIAQVVVTLDAEVLTQKQTGGEQTQRVLVIAAAGDARLPLRREQRDLLRRDGVNVLPE